MLWLVILGTWAVANVLYADKAGFPALTLAPAAPTPMSRQARRFARYQAYKEGM